MVLSLFDGEEQELLRSIASALPPDVEAYLVGGAVRDALLKRKVRDFDFALDKSARKAGKRAADALGGAFMMLDEEREVSRVILAAKDGGRLVLDFSVYRAGDLEGDLRARDFTINALAVDLRRPEKIIDPTGGLEHLRTKRLELCSPNSFQEDSLRTVRAVRMAVEFNLRMGRATLKALHRAVPLLKRVSAERLRDEFFKILDGRKVSASLRLMERFGLLPSILPELGGIRGLEQSLPHEMDVWEHTLAVVDGLERVYALLCEDYQEGKGDNLTLGLAVLKLGRFRPQLMDHFTRRLNPDRTRKSLLMLAGLLHDVGKSSTLSVGSDGRRHFYTHEVTGGKLAEEIGARLTLSNQERDHLAALVRRHMRIHMISKESPTASRHAVYHYFRDTGDAGIDICLLSLADMLSRRSGAPEFTRWERELTICEQLMESYWNHEVERINPPRLINGEDLMARFGLSPGRLVGGALEAVREAQACGDISNSEEALQFAADWLRERQP